LPFEPNEQAKLPLPEKTSAIRLDAEAAVSLSDLFDFLL